MPFYILGAVSNSLFISWANSNGTSLIIQFMNHPGNTIMKVCKSTDWNVWTMFLCHQVVRVSKSKAVSSSSPQSSTVVQTCAGLPQTRGGVSQTLAVLQAGPRYQPSFPCLKYQCCLWSSLRIDHYSFSKEIFHPKDAACFFIRTALEKFSITSLAHQWILCSEWVPSEL